MAKEKGMNPWEILGLKEGASDKEIKKAFRDLAKKCHPDKGGDAEVFAEISKAFALIKTKDARKRFERDQGRPEKSLTSMAIEVILLKIMAGIQQSQNITQLKYKPIIRQAEAAFQEDLAHMRKDHEGNRWQIRIMTDLVDRFVYNGEDGNDFITYALRDEIRSTKLKLRSIELQMRVAARGLSLLKKYEFNKAVREFPSTDFTNRSFFIYGD